MILDNTIDEESARYFCVVHDFEIKDAVKKAKEAAKSDSAEKIGVQAAMALGPKPKTLNENWFTDLLKAPPAWAEEPTGFNLCSPEDVFKDDVKSGVEGYNKGQNMALAVSGAALASSIQSVRHAAARLEKSIMKTATRHPVTAATAALVASNPESTAKLVKNTVSDIGSIGKFVGSLEPYLNRICGFFKPLVDFFKDHPIYASALGAIGYGLLKTYPVWSPYLRRLVYEATSGGALAAVEFEANDKSWRFEYSQKKNKWVLLNAGRIAPPEDSGSFMKTDFAGKFIRKCAENFECLFKNKDVVVAQAALAGNVSEIRKILRQEKRIRANMFTGKMILENIQ